MRPLGSWIPEEFPVTDERPTTLTQNERKSFVPTNEQLGKKLSELEARSPLLALPRSASIGWNVPCHYVAWQRRFRMVALCGLCTSIRSLFGGPDSALSPEPDCSPDALAMHRHSLRPDLYPLVEPDSDYCANCFGVPCSCA